MPQHDPACRQHGANSYKKYLVNKNPGEENDPGEENERKGDQKLEDDKKGKRSSIANESKPTTSETNSINNKKTNKQKNNSADISKYFNQTNRMVKK